MRDGCGRWVRMPFHWSQGSHTQLVTDALRVAFHTLPVEKDTGPVTPKACKIWSWDQARQQWKLPLESGLKVGVSLQL